MKRFSDRIPNKVLKEVFPSRLNRRPASEQIYTHLRQMILSGKLRKGQRLLNWKFVQIFDVNEGTVSKAFAQLKKEGLIIIKPGEGSVVA